MTYRQDVAEARDRYESALEQAEAMGAADAVRIAEEWEQPLKTVCKEIAGTKWHALEMKAHRYKRDDHARDRDIKKAQVRAIRALGKTDPDLLVEETAKAIGQTRAKAPSNQAKVEQAFGPTEFNRLEDAEDAVLERLPDLAPNAEDKEYAQELAKKTHITADALEAWAKGKGIGEEAEAWLEAN